MHPLQPILLVMLLAATGVAVAAGECRLKFRVNTSGSPISETLNANQSRTLDRNGVIEARNDGRNDLLLTLENLGATSSVVLVRTANAQTLLLPPALFTGQKLKSVLCRPHASVLDVGEALARFANPTHAVQQATTKAEQSVQTVRADTLALFDPAVSQQLLQQMLQMMQLMQTAGRDERGPSGAAAPPPIDLGAKFPELRTALEASRDLRAGVAATVVEDQRSRLATVLGQLQALDRKYRVGTVAQGASGAALLAQHFPEIDAARRPACSVEPPPLPHLDVQLRAFSSQLRTLLQQLPAGVPPAVRQRMLEVQEPLSSLTSTPWPLAEFHRVGSRFGLGFPHVAGTPTGLPYASVPVPYPSLPPLLAPAGVSAAAAELEDRLARAQPVTMEFLARFTGLGGIAESARADAQRVASLIAARGADSAALGRALQALNAEIAAGGGQLAGDLRALGDAALAVDRLRESVRSGSTTMAGCVAQQAGRLASAAQTAPQRLAAFAGSGAMQVQVPIPVRQALDTSLERAAALGPRLATLNQRVAVLPASHAQFEAARAQVLAGTSPVPAADLPQRVQAMQQALARWQSDLIAAQQAATAVNQSHGELASTQAMLVLRLGEQGGALASDGQGLAKTTFDASAYTADLARAQVLVPLWQQVVTTLPARVAALAAPAAPPSGSPSRSADLAFAQARIDAMKTCRDTAVDRRESIAQAQLMQAAVAQSVAGLQQQITTVVASLAGLLPPSPSSLAQVPQVLGSARQVSQRIDGVGPAAAQNFRNTTAALRGQLLTAAQCFQSNHQQAESALARLRG